METTKNQGEDFFESTPPNGSVGSIDNFFDEEPAVTTKTEDDLLGGNVQDDLDFEDEDIIPEVKTTTSRTPEHVEIELEDGNQGSLTANNDLLTTLMERNIIDSDIVIEDEDGNEIDLKEVDLTDDEIYELIGRAIDAKIQSANEGKISTKGISDFTKQLIEIENNGGDVKSALESYEKFKSPMNEIDISTTDGQVDAIYLTLQAKGLADKDIKSLIETYDTNGELEERAIKAKEDLDKAFDKQIEDLRQQSADRKKEYEKFIQKYGVDLKSELENTFELTPAIVKKLSSLAAKPGDDGKFELDKIYQEKRKDPKEAARLALFLADPNEYDKQVSNKEVDRSNRRTFSEIRLTRRGGGSSGVTRQKSSSSRKNKEVSLDEMS